MGGDGGDGEGGKRGHSWDIQRYPFCHHALTAAARVTQPPSPNREGCCFPAADQTPPKVCGWLNLVAASLLVCQVVEQKGQAEVRHTRAWRISDAKSRRFKQTRG